MRDLVMNQELLLPLLVMMWTIHLAFRTNRPFSIAFDWKKGIAIHVWPGKS
jgi:hypothetical protein